MIPTLCVGGRLSTHILPTGGGATALMGTHTLPTDLRISCRPGASFQHVRGALRLAPIVQSPVKTFL
jgi:hypothetical protein